MNTCTCPFKKYTLTGRGIGLKIVTLVSLLIGIIVGVTSPVTILNYLNQNNSLDEFIKTLPIVTIENGKIVSPVYDNDTIYVPNPKSGKDLKIIVNTAVDSVDAIPADVALYVTARNIYSPTNVMTFPADLTTVITHDTIHDIFKKIIWAMGAVTGLMIFLLGIIGFLGTYLPTMILGKAINTKLTIDAWGRILAWPWSILYGIATLLAIFAGVALSPVYVILIASLITWIIGTMITTASDECDGCCCGNGTGCSCRVNKDDEHDIVLQAVETEPEEEIVTKPATATIETTVTRKNDNPVVRTKKATVKPKNVPTSQKGKKKK